jgi:hypothetical protein
LGFQFTEDSTKKKKRRNKRETLGQNKNYGNSNISSMQKYTLKKILFKKKRKKNQNPSRYYNF